MARKDGDDPTQSEYAGVLHAIVESTKRTGHWERIYDELSPEEREGVAEAVAHDLGRRGRRR